MTQKVVQVFEICVGVAVKVVVFFVTTLA